MTPPSAKLEKGNELSPKKIAELSSILESDLPTGEKWNSVSKVLSQWKSTPDSYRTIWETHFNEPGQLSPLWWPTPERIDQSNVGRWMREKELTNFQQFHQWTSKNRREFWAEAIKRLGIVMHSQGDQVLASEDDPAHAIWYPDAKMNIVESCFLADPKSTAIVSQAPGEPLRYTSFGQLREETNQVANSLRQAGFVIGDRIAVALPMTRISIPLYLGIVAAGCSVVSIADSFAAPEIRTRLEISEAKAIFTYDVVNRVGKELPMYSRVAEATHLPIIVLSNRDSLAVEIREQDMAWSDFLVDDKEFEFQICAANDCANVLFSSGTTGDPKAIVWNHLTPVRCAIDGYVHQDIHENDVAVWPTNLGWMMGPWLIFASLINKAAIGLYEDAPMTAEFGQFIQDSKATMLGVVPTIVKSWRKSKVMESFDWSSIKCFSSTGETSQSDDMFYLSTLAGMKPIIEYCGGTEIGGGYVTSTVVQPNVASTFTTPSVGLDFVLLSSGESENGIDQENRRPADEGEVFLIPPSIGLSNQLLNRDHFETYYANVPDMSKTGDSEVKCLRRHGDHFRKIGNYYVAGGRTDDTMNLGGIKVSSAELERVLNGIESIRETAAIAISDESGPDRLVVFTVLDEEFAAKQTCQDFQTQLKSEMNTRLKTELNPLFKVSQLELIESLPRTASNKVMRRKLRDQCLA